MFQEGIYSKSKYKRKFENTDIHIYITNTHPPDKCPNGGSCYIVFTLIQFKIGTVWSGLRLGPLYRSLSHSLCHFWSSIWRHHEQTVKKIYTLTFLQRNPVFSLMWSAQSEWRQVLLCPGGSYWFEASVIFCWRKWSLDGSALMLSSQATFSDHKQTCTQIVSHAPAIHGGRIY